MENALSPVQLHQFNDKSKSFNAWINVGYELFAHEGPEGIQTERLARILNLNKSGFYHYFGSPEIFFEKLMQHHLSNVDMAAQKIQTVRNFMPECIQFLSDFSIPILAQMQLQRASHTPLFASTFLQANKKMDPVIIPLWSNFIESSDYPALSARYYEFFRDIFYARVRPSNLSFKFICDISIEAKEICDGFKQLNLFNGNSIARRSA